MANPRKPTALKRLHGTLRRDRINPLEPEGIEGRPVPPRAFVFGARDEWDRMVDNLESFGVLRKQHAEALYRLVEAVGEAQQLANQAIAGRDVNETRRGKVETDVRLYLKDFGLTAADQSRVSKIQKPSENPFAALAPKKVVEISQHDR